MSKLQEAIKRIRDSRPPERSAGSAINGTHAGQRKRARTVVTVRDGEGLESETTLPRFATIPEEVRLECGLDPIPGSEAQVARQFGRIKRPIMLNAFDLTEISAENPNVIMVASALPETGKTFCALNLARSIAQERDFGALLVDADVLKPRVTRALDLEGSPGLTDYLLDDSLSLEDVLVQTDCDGIIVLPSGNPHRDATELLASRRMRELVKLLSQRYTSRAILFDTPPLLMTNEAVVLTQYTGQVVFVIEAGVTSVEAVNAALGLIDRDKPVNAILNKVKDAPGDVYMGTAYYGYGSASEEARSST